MDYLKAFIVGGAICAVTQILIDKTKLTPARILVMLVVAGAILGGLGWYEPLIKWAGAGATVPLTGFGSTLAKGVIKAVDAKGFDGIFTGGITETSAGIAASIFFAFIIAAIFSPKEKEA